MEAKIEKITFTLIPNNFKCFVDSLQTKPRLLMIRLRIQTRLEQQSP